MSKIQVLNGHIMVREVVRKEEEKKAGSFYLPQEVLEDEQASQGEVVETSSEEYKVGNNIIFHKVIPIDVSMKYGEDTELRVYWFIKEKDVICKIID